MAPSIGDALATIRWSDLSLGRILTLPCAAHAFGGGLLVGGAFGLVGARRGLKTSVKLSVAGFIVSSIVLWEFCRLQRRVARNALDALNINSPEQL